jgi:peptide/nickel transport system substrate-binding protein
VEKWYKRGIIFSILIIFFTVFLMNSSEIIGMYNNFSNSLGHTGANKKLIIGRASDSISLDPANTTEIDSFSVSVNIFDTLV